MNSANEESIEERNLRVRVEKENYEMAIRAILTAKEGQFFFKRFFAKAKIFSKTFTGNSQTYFNEGQREMALEYFKDFSRICPVEMSELWLSIIEEEK
jgi:hypothetical protein